MAINKSFNLILIIPSGHALTSFRSKELPQRACENALDTLIEVMPPWDVELVDVVMMEMPDIIMLARRVKYSVRYR